MSALLVGSHIRGHASIRTRAVAICHVTLVTSNSFQYAIRFTRYVICEDTESFHRGGPFLPEGVLLLQRFFKLMIPL